MKKTFKYNLNYIGGIAEYQKRAIYTLNLKENSFSCKCFIIWTNGVIR